MCACMYSFINICVYIHTSVADSLLLPQKAPPPPPP